MPSLLSSLSLHVLVPSFPSPALPIPSLHVLSLSTCPTYPHSPWSCWVGLIHPQSSLTLFP
ncbi:hypothetical protein I79_010132 [Cricetulus griseus]|uniref:Uncharacterized protein n=1 Tax=Cricetulus griseus TaxID=10029 RepID=G3HHM8_CRIGR|nr:hypothetical protein I79_010132 [Cricetulus griseus]